MQGNNTGKDLYDFQLTTDDAKDNTNEEYNYMGISLNGSNFQTGIATKLRQSATRLSGKVLGMFFLFHSILY
ncbi:hypothetical protein, partial [Prevotella sp.]|uniref:hypothetical protein n=1 Tax=Prevotella sp. TaxID=59823 RepID=UPI0040291E58